MTQELREYGRSANGKALPNEGAVVEEIRLASKPLDNKDIPCAFWDALPEPGSEHPDLLAIEALKAESSPLERAETLKVQGNDALKRGMQLKKSFYVLEGVGLYNQALALLAPSVERETSGDFFPRLEREGGASAAAAAGGASAAAAAASAAAAEDAKKAAGEEKTAAAAAAAAAAATPPQPCSSDAADEPPPSSSAPSPPPAADEVAAMRATLLSNRAQAHLALGNDRRALADALRATELDPRKATKAFFRAARAALRLREWGACGAAIRAGKESASFLGEGAEGGGGGGGGGCGGSRPSVLADFEALSHSLSEAEAAARAAEEEKRRAEALARAPSLALAREIAEKRRWRVGYPQLSVGADRNKPWAVAGVVHWPLVFVYPESGATDAVEAASELGPMSEHLDAMFGSLEGGDGSSAGGVPPLPWDEHGAYKERKDIELYYLSFATEPLPDVDALTDVLHKGWPEGLQPLPPRRHGPKAARAVKVDEAWTLGEVLSREDFVVPGIPAFFVLSKSKRGRAAEVRRRFLEENE